MVTSELRSRARRYGYTGKTQEQMLQDLHHDKSVDTMNALVREWSRAKSKLRSEDGCADAK